MGNNRRASFMIIAGIAVFSHAMDISISGVVQNESDKSPLAGAVVAVHNGQLSTVTRDDGSFLLQGALDVAITPKLSGHVRPPRLRVSGNAFELFIAKDNSPVTLELFSCRGQKIAAPFKGVLNSGKHRFPVSAGARQLAVLRLTVNGGVETVAFLGGSRSIVPMASTSHDGYDKSVLAAIGNLVSDTLCVAKSGYVPKRLPIDSYQLTNQAVGLNACNPGDKDVPWITAGSSVTGSHPTPKVSAADMYTLVEGNTRFALDMYRQLAVKDTGNLFFSPYSISVALAMAYSGANGETEAEMKKALCFLLDEPLLHAAFGALYDTLKIADESVPELTISSANQAWGQAGAAFVPAFLDVLARYYGAGMHCMNFAGEPEPCRVAINGWVLEKTNSKIKDLLPPGSITPQTVLVLTNAVYYKASWLYPFNKAYTADKDFTCAGNTIVKVPMMMYSAADSQVNLKYAQTSDWRAVELPYSGKRLVMDVIVPKTGSLTEAEASLKYDTLALLLARFSSWNLFFQFPKFTISTPSVSLAAAFKNLGMVKAFGNADFSGMLSTQSLFITDIFHKAFIAVDEEGTEAAAATAIPAAGGIEDTHFTVNKPFIFLIRDVKTKAILFLGRVMNPVAR